MQQAIRWLSQCPGPNVSSVPGQHTSDWHQLHMAAFVVVKHQVLSSPAALHTQLVVVELEGVL
jgi:cbb3-type cytochrome oxidase cytochrome c subunit